MIKLPDYLKIENLMQLQPHWRVLTIGDGDLTFSLSIAKHHQIESLTATVLDEKVTLLTKYQNNAYSELHHLGVPMAFGFDVTNPDTWPCDIKHQFDVVIFQFPLVPAKTNHKALQQGLSPNILNRHLLRQFLLNAHQHFLKPDGARLAYITSKEVKPYIHWNIETALTIDTAIHYLGKQDFDVTQFPGYQVRNVDRDKHVKDTKGFIYVYSDKPRKDAFELSKHPASGTAHYCDLCYVGPFTGEEDKAKHLLSKRHRQMAQYHQQWIDYLRST